LLSELQARMKAMGRPEYRPLKRIPDGQAEYYCHNCGATFVGLRPSDSRTTLGHGVRCQCGSMPFLKRLGR
jgi:DNA-directed RNA polymerase subunit RPC12/RpoP